MKIGIMSDLHTEWGPYNGPIGEGNVLLVPGDTCVAAHMVSNHPELIKKGVHENALKFFNRAAENYDKVIAVAGNHEHWAGIFNYTHNILRDKFPQITWLNKEFAEYNGVVFYGATFWTNFDDQDITTMREFKSVMMDSEMTWVYDPDDSMGQRHLSAQDVLEDHFAALRGLKSAQAYAQDNAQKLVVLSHHAPSYKSVAPRWRAATSNAYYYSNLESYMGSENMPLWVHGHMHDRADYMIGDTRVICNPRGYVGQETKNFQPIIIDI